MASAPSPPEPILEVRNLKTVFLNDTGVVKAVDDVDFEVFPGSTLGLLGESGCGKSVTALSIMRLIQQPKGRIVSGEIKFEGMDLLRLSKSKMRRIRGNKISMIFQEPMTALNPVYRVGDQIAEAIMLHQKLSKTEAMKLARKTLDLVRIPSPDIRMKDYPHQMSGGMRQRIMIGMALCCRPRLMIADEPTTALDVTVQAQVMDLIQQLKDELGTSVILITHDLGVIAENAQQVAVMYAGRIVENAKRETLFNNPLHPYTKGLMLSTPQHRSTYQKGKRLPVIPGIVPRLDNLPEGCAFADRCPEVHAECRLHIPELITLDGNHKVRCINYSALQR